VRFLLFFNPVTATIPSKKNKLALHFAAGEGHLAIVRQLLQLYPEGALTKSSKGKLPLHFAARWGHLDVAQDLLRVFPDGIRALDSEGSLPLHDACREGQVRMAEFLFRQYPRGLMTANIRHEIPLFPAVRTGNLELVVPLIQAWPAGGSFVIRHAGQDDNVEFWSRDVLELVLRGAVGNFTNCTLLDGREAPPLCNRDSVLYSGGDETDSECSTVSLTSEEELVEKQHNNAKVASCRCRNDKKKSSKKRRCKDNVSDRPKKRVRSRRTTGSGCEFLPLHSALAGGANAHVLRHVLNVFSDQLTKQDCRGRLPLHVAMEYCRGADTATLVLDKILKPYPEAAAVKENDGRLALHVGLAKRADFCLIQGLLEANPASGFTSFSEKLPIHIAMENNCDLSTLYVLLRGDPCVVSDLVSNCA
jgi:ankyrin repeat protein